MTSLDSAFQTVPPKAVPALVLAASLAVLGTALLSQYWGGLQPCVLCLYQRDPYWLAIALSVLALAALARGTRRWARYLVALTALGFLTGAAIAVFHVGVEQHWWTGTAECGASGPLAGGNAADLRSKLLAQPVVRCDEVAWSLLGISMAGFNVLVSLGLALFAWLGARRLSADG
jgi:disulfide bond formation protein DsbB